MLEKYLRDQLSIDRTADTLEDIIKQFEDNNLTVTWTSHDTQTINMRASTHYNNGMETLIIHFAQTHWIPNNLT